MSLAPALGAPINCGTFVGGTAPIRAFAKAPIASSNFRLRLSKFFRVVSVSSSAAATAQDRNVTRLTGPSLISDYGVAVEYLSPAAAAAAITFSSSDTSKLLSPVNGLAQAVSTGEVILKATTATGEFAAAKANVETAAGSSSDEFISYVSGSAAKHAIDSVDTRIAGKSVTARPIFTTQNHAAATYVRNPNCWAADINLTCISPWNSTGGAGLAGTLISPRHVLFCEHYNFHPSAGATIRFVAQDNTVVTRTITALLAHPDYVPFYPDITIGVLDSDVPGSIAFAKILPQNWRTYFPSVGGPFISQSSFGPRGLPALALDQEEKALVTDWRNAMEDTGINQFSKPTNAQRLVFYEDIIPGDSGNPAFLIINNELVVLNTWTYGGPGMGTHLVPHKNAINTMMTQLGGGYQLTEVNLTGFPTY